MSLTTWKRFIQINFFDMMMKISMSCLQKRLYTLHRAVVRSVSSYLWCMVLHGIAWYCMVLHGIKWFCMVLYGIAWYCMVLHGIALSCIILPYLALSCTGWYLVVLGQNRAVLVASVICFQKIYGLHGETINSFNIWRRKKWWQTDKWTNGQTEFPI